MNRDLLAIFEYLEREKGIKREITTKAIEDALIASAKKGQAFMNNLTITVNPKTAEIVATARKEVVDHIEYPEEEILLEEAMEIDPDVSMGDWVEAPVDPKQFGRIAAQVARQLISQKFREAERDVIYEEYRDRMGELISGTIVRVTKAQSFIVDLGKVEAILPERYQSASEKHHVGEKIVALLYEVQDTDMGGAHVILSRSHPEFVTALLEQEVPETEENIIEIKKVVRHAGFRTKITVISHDAKIDPVGSCVGVRGNRIKNIIRELQNEKIDVLPHSDDPIELLRNAFSPIELRKVDYQIDNNLINVIVADDDYPSVLGKGGNNVKLTSALLNINVKVYKFSQYKMEATLERAQLAQLENAELDTEFERIPGVSQLMLDSVTSYGYNTYRKLLKASPEDLAKELNVSQPIAEDLLECAQRAVKDLLPKGEPENAHQEADKESSPTENEHMGNLDNPEE